MPDDYKLLFMISPDSKLATLSLHFSGTQPMDGPFCGLGKNTTACKNQLVQQQMWSKETGRRLRNK